VARFWEEFCPECAHSHEWSGAWCSHPAAAKFNADIFEHKPSDLLIKTAYEHRERKIDSLLHTPTSEDITTALPGVLQFVATAEEEDGDHISVQTILQVSRTEAQLLFEETIINEIDESDDEDERLPTMRDIGKLAADNHTMGDTLREMSDKIDELATEALQAKLERELELRARKTFEMLVHMGFTPQEASNMRNIICNEQESEHLDPAKAAADTAKVPPTPSPMPRSRDLNLVANSETSASAVGSSVDDNPSGSMVMNA